VCSAATAAIRHLKTSQSERDRHQDRAARTKAVLAAAALPVMTSRTHIVPVFVGDPERCKEASDLLLSDHGIYIQPINYPTVPKGTERLRITPTGLSIRLPKHWWTCGKGSDCFSRRGLAAGSDI
jgi:5-aminolevulinate synthase